MDNTWVHFYLLEQISLVHWQYCVIKGDISHAAIRLGSCLTELLQFLNYKIHDLLLFLVDEEVAHHSLILVLQLKEYVCQAHVGAHLDFMVISGDSCTSFRLWCLFVFFF